MLSHRSFNLNSPLCCPLLAGLPGWVPSMYFPLLSFWLAKLLFYFHFRSTVLKEMQIPSCSPSPGTSQVCVYLPESFLCCQFLSSRGVFLWPSIHQHLCPWPGRTFCNPFPSCAQHCQFCCHLLCKRGPRGNIPRWHRLLRTCWSQELRLCV